MSLRVSVRPAARVRHRRAEDAGEDSRPLVRGLLLATVSRGRVPAPQFADRLWPGRRADRADARGHSRRERRGPSPACRQRRLLRGRATRGHDRPFRERLSVRRRGARDRRAAILARHGGGRQTDSRRQCPRPCVPGRSYPSAPARQRSGLHDGGRDTHALAALVPPLHVLRLSVLFRLDIRGGGLSHGVRLAGAVWVHQPARRPRDRWRSRARGGHGRPSARATPA